MNTRTHGKFENRVKVYPPVIGCQFLKLKITIAVSPAIDEVKLGHAIVGLIESASTLDRELGGQGLEIESNQAVDGRVELVLTAVDTIGSDLRIQEIVQCINNQSVNETSLSVRALAA